MTPLLELRDLTVSFGSATVVSRLSLQIEPGERVGVVGESGSGKTVAALAVMGLLPAGMTTQGTVLLDGEDLLGASERRRCALRGARLAMVFQEPGTALNPVMRVGKQVAEVLRTHRPVPRRAATRQAEELLAEVKLEDPARQARAYPHELSGGQRQRVMLAIALACRPALLLADEPTTALDVLRQDQLLHLLRDLAERAGSALVLISHDLAVVSSLCHRVVVLYGGHAVEWGETRRLLARPRHPYTAGLVAASLAVSVDRQRSVGPLATIPGAVPELGAFPSGCVFQTRCSRASEHCRRTPPAEAGRHGVACWHPLGPRDDDEPFPPARVATWRGGR